MKKMIWMIMAWMAVFVMVSGCSQSSTQQAEQAAPGKGSVSMPEKIAKTADEAIKIAKTLETVQQKKEYLITQAESLYNSKQFQEVVDVAQHILQYVDKDAVKAKQLLANAQKELQAMVQGGVNQAAEKVKGLQL